MAAIPHKAKQYLLATAKVLILILTFGYIFYKLTSNPRLSIGEFWAVIFSKGTGSLIFFHLALVFVAANWFFEILKWQALVSSFKEIDLKTAYRQSLAAHAISLATPNRLGEYGAKAIYFDRKDRKKVLLLNFFSGASQMLVTSVFGCFGLLFFTERYGPAFLPNIFGMGGFIVITVLVAGYLFRKKEFLIKGFSIEKTVGFFKRLSVSAKLKTVVFALARYLIFCSLFYGLLLFFGAKLTALEAFPLICSMYFLVSVLPAFFLLDVVIRGGVAVWLFSFAGVPELVILLSVLAMWLFNFVLPAIWGSIFVLKLQPAAR